MYLLANSTNIAIRRESLYIFTNLILTTQNAEVRMKCVSYQNYLLIKLFVLGLTSINDANIILEIVLSLEPLLELDKIYKLTGENCISFMFEAEGGIDKIEELQKHPNASIYNAIEVLVTKYFGEDDQGVEDAGMAMS